MAVEGDTVWPGMTFRDSTGAPVEPDGDVTLRIVVDYKEAEALVVVIPRAQAVSLGRYEYPFLTPRGSAFVYEFSALVGGTVELGRKVEPITRTSP